MTAEAQKTIKPYYIPTRRKPNFNYYSQYRRILTFLKGTHYHGQYYLNHSKQVLPYLETPISKLTRYYCSRGSMLKSRSKILGALSVLFSAIARGDLHQDVSIYFGNPSFSHLGHLVFYQNIQSPNNILR